MDVVQEIEVIETDVKDCDEDGDPCDGKIPELKVQKKNKV